MLGGGFALCLSVYAIAREMPVLQYGDQQSLATTVAIAAGELRPAFSFYGQKRLMAGCVQGMTGLWAALATPEQRKSHAEQCLGYAITYTSHTSLEPLTWTVAARASFILGDHEGLNTYLEHAWRSGRNEQWVAGLRVALAEEVRPVLSESNQSNHRSDLALMVMSRSGIAAIADRYWSDLSFRERITAIVEQLPEAEQRRFVSSVRRAAPN